MLLTAVTHPKKHDHYRVPVLVYDRGELYEVFIGDTLVLRYDRERLPTCIKERLAMISAIPAPEHVRQDRFERPFTTDIYTNSHDPRLNDIGWQWANDCYVVVISETEVDELKGEMVPMGESRMAYEYTRSKG